MTGEVFNSMWIEAFGWGLTDSSGLKQWTEFIDSPKSNDGAVRATLAEFSKRYNTAKTEGRSNYRDCVPTLEEFRRLYFALLPKLKIQWAQKQTVENNGGRCPMCGGDGHVFGLSWKREWDGMPPAHPMEIELDKAYYGVTAYDCPVCRAEAYSDPVMRDAVHRNCVPDRLPVGHPCNPHDYVECGPHIIMEVLSARMVKAGLAEPPKPTNPELKALFAQMMALGKKKPQPKRTPPPPVSDDLAAQFGPA